MNESRPKHCQARTMDIEHFGVTEDPVPHCREAPTHNVRGYWLCEGCAYALQALGVIADKLKDPDDE